MTIVVEFDALAEQQLRHALSKRDRVAIQKLLSEAVASTAEGLLKQAAASPEDDEFDSALDRLVSGVTQYRAEPCLVLSDYAATRSSIYEEEHT